MAMVGGPTAIPGLGTTVSPLPTWTSIFDTDVGSTNTITLAGITAPITISAAITGTGTLFYFLNGAFLPYTGAFSASAGDSLGWTIENGDSRRLSGVITNVK